MERKEERNGIFNEIIEGLDWKSKIFVYLFSKIFIRIYKKGIEKGFNSRM